MAPGTDRYQLAQSAINAAYGYVQSCGTEDPDYEFVCGFAVGTPDEVWVRVETVLRDVSTIEAWQREDDGDFFDKRVEVDGGTLDISLANVLGDALMTFMFIPVK